MIVRLKAVGIDEFLHLTNRYDSTGWLNGSDVCLCAEDHSAWYTIPKASNTHFIAVVLVCEISEAAGTVTIVGNTTACTTVAAKKNDVYSATMDGRSSDTRT